MSFSKHFERTVVISLPERHDRRARLLENFRQHNLADPSNILWQDAVDGRVEKPPAWWKQGPGAWGCRASHLAVLEAAQRDGVESVLIIEDDACFHHRTAEWLEMLMPLLPPDWDQFFLGGQHMRPPAATPEPRLLRGTCITRTHAYAIHRRAFDSLISAIGNLEEYRAHPGWHVDHQFGTGHHHGRWKAYAPAWWLAGQDEGLSDIAVSSYDRRWWPQGNHYWQLPFIQYSADDAASRWLYRPDVALEEIPANRMQRSLWLRNAAMEAWDQGRLPTCDLSPEEIAKLWPGGLRTPGTPEELSHLADYPANGLFSHPFYQKSQTQNHHESYQ